MDSSKQFFDSVKRLEELTKTFPDEIRKAKTPEEMQQKLQELTELAAKITKPLEEIYGNLEQSFLPVEGSAAEPENDLLKAHPEWIESASTAKIYADLMPYINLELAENPKANSEPLFFVIAAAAKRARADGQEIPRLKAEDAAETYKKELPRATAKRVEILTYPLDKPNNSIWRLLEPDETDGETIFVFDVTRDGEEPGKATVTYSINFDALSEVGIDKQLTPHDKRVYIAVAALWNGGNKTMTATQIYKMMGSSKQPNDGDISKINDSLTKMGAARITLDNAKEATVYSNYKRFQYDAPLLPFERISLYQNNAFTDSAIRLFREPPLITFAKQRKQITVINQKLLESPVSKTIKHLMIDDYLIREISHMKNTKTKRNRKMLYDTIFKECKITETKDRSRQKDYIKKYLDHYKECNFIKGYSLLKDGIIIDL